ncbi:DUF721 domain-containing protein [Brevibacterium album]|uniref:DUF721 domain-containing protein n=1 Tax=Brevibacterium album TaxID=417948 RepID=UPI00041C0731|nr:DciA family protein [Brevibacterium album]
MGAADRTRAPLSSAALEALDRVRRMADHEPRPGSRWAGPRREDAGPGLGAARARGLGEVAYTAAGADPRDPRPLAGMFSRLVQKRGWTSSLDVAQLTERWEELVGGDVAAHCTVEKFEPPVLVVRTSSTTWATQLKILREGLLDKLEREMGRRVVEDIEIRGPEQRRFTRGRRSVKGRGPRDTWG